MTGREEELEQRCRVSKGFFLTLDESLQRDKTKKNIEMRINTQQAMVG